MVVLESIQTYSVEFVPELPEVIVPPLIVYPPLRVKGAEPLTRMPPFVSRGVPDPPPLFAMLSVPVSVLVYPPASCTIKSLIVLLGQGVAIAPPAITTLALAAAPPNS